MALYGKLMLCLTVLRIGVLYLNTDSPRHHQTRMLSTGLCNDYCFLPNLMRLLYLLFIAILIQLLGEFFSTNHANTYPRVNNKH